MLSLIVHKFNRQTNKSQTQTKQYYLRCTVTGGNCNAELQLQQLLPPSPPLLLRFFFFSQLLQYYSGLGQVHKTGLTGIHAVAFVQAWCNLWHQQHQGTDWTDQPWKHRVKLKIPKSVSNVIKTRKPTGCMYWPGTPTLTRPGAAATALPAAPDDARRFARLGLCRLRLVPPAGRNSGCCSWSFGSIIGGGCSSILLSCHQQTARLLQRNHALLCIFC